MLNIKNLIKLSVFLLFITLFNFMYNYCNILRFAVCLSCLYIFYKIYSNRKFTKNNISLLIIAATYNPFIQVNFRKNEWIITNIITICFLLYFLLKDNKELE